MKSECFIKKFYEMIKFVIFWKFMAVGAYIIKCERLKINDFCALLRNQKMTYDYNKINCYKPELNKKN